MQARRQQYLQAMGIQVWQQRVRSSGASLDAKAPESEDIQSSQFETQSTNRPVGETEDHFDTRRTTDNSSEFVKRGAPCEQGKNIDIPEFRLASIAFPDVCLIVSQVPLQIPEPVEARHLSYLKSLLFSLGLTSTGTPQVTLFNWPMLRNANFDQSGAAAREASRAFLKAQKMRHSVPFVLLMGKEPGHYLLPDAGSFKADRGRLVETDDGQMLLTESIDSVFCDPQLKADVWADLQALRKTTR